MTNSTKNEKYNGQLKAWAVDRAIEAFKAAKREGFSIEELTEEAQKLVEYCFEPEVQEEQEGSMQ